MYKSLRMIGVVVLGLVLLVPQLRAAEVVKKVPLVEFREQELSKAQQTQMTALLRELHRKRHLAITMDSNLRMSALKQYQAEFDAKLQAVLGKSLFEKYLRLTKANATKAKNSREEALRRRQAREAARKKATGK